MYTIYNDQALNNMLSVDLDSWQLAMSSYLVALYGY